MRIWKEPKANRFHKNRDYDVCARVATGRRAVNRSVA